MEWTKGEFVVTDEQDRMDKQRIGELLRTTYWASERTQPVVDKCVSTSMNFALFQRERMIGYARVVTDVATQGYLCDVVMEEPLRGQGLGSWLLECVLSHPELATCRIDLVTDDAHEFYRKYGFGSHRYDFLVRYPPDDYAGGSGSDGI
ncbi:MAG: GNAT family N-acetyltransferase [Limisphaerales bacterium]